LPLADRFYEVFWGLNRAPEGTRQGAARQRPLCARRAADVRAAARAPSRGVGREARAVKREAQQARLRRSPPAPYARALRDVSQRAYAGCSSAPAVASLSCAASAA
jgi:hypothetical protein